MASEERQTRTVKLGERTVQFPSEELGQMEDSNHLLGDIDALRHELQQKGYLFIRGLHNRDEVLEAREAVLKYIVEGGKDKILEPVSKGVLDVRCGRGCIPYMEGRNDISHSKEVLKVLEGERPKTFFNKLLGKQCMTFDYKWLRGVHREGFTGAHVDNVYMGRGTKQLYTMWTPVGDVTVDMGTLCMCESSNNLESFKPLQDTYGNLDVEAVKLEGSGWFTTDPFDITDKFGGHWKTTDYKAGDVMIFTMRTVHMSTSNLTDLVRISCDTRWQSQEDPVDVRYMGHFEAPKDMKFGLHADDNTEVSNEKTTMKKLRQTWGL